MVQNSNQKKTDTQTLESHKWFKTLTQSPGAALLLEDLENYLLFTREIVTAINWVVTCILEWKKLSQSENLILR